MRCSRRDDSGSMVDRALFMGRTVGLLGKVVAKRVILPVRGGMSTVIQEA